MNDDDLRAAFDDLVAPLPSTGSLPIGIAARGARRRRAKLAALGGTGALAVGGVLLLGLSLPTSEPTERLLPADPPASASPSPTPAPTPQPSPSAEPDPGTGAPTPPAPPTTPTEPAALPSGVVLEGGALIVTDEGETSSLVLYEADAETARRAVAEVLGAGQEQALPDCGADVVTVTFGPLQQSLQLVLDGGTLVGYTSTRPDLSAVDGFAVGSTLAELREVRPDVTVSEGTLGAQFSLGDDDVVGFLDGTAESSEVTTIGAGNRCLFG